MKKILTIAAAALVLAACNAPLSSDRKEQKVRKTVYVIIDGVPADMIERMYLPNIQEIASRGHMEGAMSEAGSGNTTRRLRSPQSDTLTS